MKRILAVLALPFTLNAATPTLHTHLHHHSHHELQTGPLSHTNHSHDSESPFLDGTLQISGFYEQRLGSADAGRFLGTQATNTEYNFVHINTAVTVAARDADATNNHFVHNTPGVDNDLNVKFTAKPSRQVYGTLFSYEQYIPLFGGWYVGAKMALADYRTDLNLKQVGRTAAQPGDLPNFFSGHYYSDTSARAQTNLNYNRFDIHEHQRGGVSQIDVWGRRQFFGAHRFKLNGSVHITVPILSPAGAQNLYAPTMGSNGHWVAGAQLHSNIEVWRRDDHCITVDLRGYTSYSLPEKEERVLAVNSALTVAPFGHYALLTHASATANTALVPAANLLRKNISITPGIAYELTGSATWHGEKWRITVGHTYHGSGAESAGSFRWNDDTYAIANASYDTSAAFNATNTEGLTDAAGNTHTYLQRTDLDKTKAVLPSYHLHTSWVQASYATRIGSIPVSLRTGTAGTVSGTSWQAHPMSAWACARISF